MHYLKLREHLVSNECVPEVRDVGFCCRYAGNNCGILIQIVIVAAAK